MELHTRDAEGAVALAQLEAAAILACKRTSCMWPRPYKVYRGSPMRGSGCNGSLRAINSLASDPADQEMVPIAGRGWGQRPGPWALWGSRSHRDPLCYRGANKPWSRLGEHMVTILFAGCSGCKNHALFRQLFSVLVSWNVPIGGRAVS